MSKTALILAILLYSLIYLLRVQQGGFEVQTEVFKNQRQSLDKIISKYLPSPQSDLLSGILLGQNKDLPIGLRLALRDTSTLHIVVASGQNLSILAGFFLGLAPIIKRKNALILSIFSASAYTFLSGVQIPILRALIMFILASIAQFSGRQSNTIRTLILTALLLLLINPEWISSLSFQLSFLATFGVVVVAPILLKYFQKLPLIGSDLAVTLSAQVMVTPILIQSFNQFSLVSLITNVLVLWTIPFIMVLGTILLIFGMFFKLGAIAIAFIANMFLTFFIYIVSFFASLPFAWEYIGKQSWVVWIGYYLILAAILLIINKKLEHP